MQKQAGKMQSWLTVYQVFKFHTILGSEAKIWLRQDQTSRKVAA